MAAPSPVTDPLWAYDTPGWTNQGSTGDIPLGSGLSSDSEIGPGEAIVQGYQAMSFDPMLTATTTQIPTAGIVYLAKIMLPDPFATTSVNIFCVAAGNATAFYLGVYSASGALVSTSADKHASLASATALVAAQITPAAASAGVVYAAMLNVGGTTTSVSAMTGPTSAAVAAGAGLVVPAATTPFTNNSPRFATVLTGQTALPATITPSAVAFSAFGLWVALS